MSSLLLISQGCFCLTLSSVLSGENIKKAAVVHSTAYDGAVERACLSMGIPVMSVSDAAVHHSYTLMTIANKLLEAMGQWLSVRHVHSCFEHTHTHTYTGIIVSFVQHARGSVL